MTCYIFAFSAGQNYNLHEHTTSPSPYNNLHLQLLYYLYDNKDVVYLQFTAQSLDAVDLSKSVPSI